MPGFFYEAVWNTACVNDSRKQCTIATGADAEPRNTVLRNDRTQIKVVPRRTSDRQNGAVYSEN